MRALPVRAGLAALALSIAGTASADDRQQKTTGTSSPESPGTQERTPSSKTTPSSTPSSKSTMQGTDVTKPRYTATEVMKITQTAMVQIAAAESALDRGDKAAARTALENSEQALDRLYDTPAMGSLLNEFDEAQRKASGKTPTLEPLDLAPLTASVRSYQAYIDPEVAAGIKEAEDKAQKGDNEGAAEALRLARNRVAIDVAFIPVEEAYIHVRAAQHALDQGDTKLAARFLRGVPIVVSEVQVATPLVPIRFKLAAAAMAAEEGNWKRSQTLVNEAAKDVQNLEKLSGKSTAATEISALADDVEKLQRQMRAEGSRPEPQAIRELAQRTRDLGA